MGGSVCQGVGFVSARTIKGRTDEAVFVRATADPGEDAIHGAPYADHRLFDRTSMQNEHMHMWPALTLEDMMREFVLSQLEFLLAEDMLGVIDQDDINAGWEDRVPERQWTFVFE
jgi:hypothetical protein